MKNKVLDIVPIGGVDDDILQRLSLTINHCFGYTCRINEQWERVPLMPTILIESSTTPP